MCTHNACEKVVNPECFYSNICNYLHQSKMQFWIFNHYYSLLYSPITLSLFPPWISPNLSHPLNLSQYLSLSLNPSQSCLPLITPNFSLSLITPQSLSPSFIPCYRVNSISTSKSSMYTNPWTRSNKIHTLQCYLKTTSTWTTRIPKCHRYITDYYTGSRASRGTP